MTSCCRISGTTNAAVVQEDSNEGYRLSIPAPAQAGPWQPDGRLYNLDVVRRQITDVARFRHVLDEFKPDLVSWWNLEGVTKAILRMPRDRGIQCIRRSIAG